MIFDEVDVQDHEDGKHPDQGNPPHNKREHCEPVAERLCGRELDLLRQGEPRDGWASLQSYLFRIFVDVTQRRLEV